MVVSHQERQAEKTSGYFTKIIQPVNKQIIITSYPGGWGVADQYSELL